MLGIAAPLAAQVPSVLDSAMRARTAPSAADSAVRADSARGELPASERPVQTEVAMSHRWNRDSLFATGALTLADFLDRVPGLYSMRARFYLAPQVAAYNGDVARVRLFLDGIELDAIDPRGGGIADLSQFPIGALDELIVERGADELRLYMRSWRGPLRYSPQTRADILTGDNRSNTFRGFLARRARNGVAFQTMLQQRSTDDRRLGGDGDATTAFVRLGLVRPRWSVDGTLLRVRSTQQTLAVIAVQDYLLTGRDIPRYDLVQRDAYLRFGMGNQDAGRWLQVMAVSRQVKENTPAGAADAAKGFVADSADTTRSSTQYVATAGWTAERLRLSFTERLRRVDGAWLQQPSARLGMDLGRVNLAAYAERNPFEKRTRIDVLARTQPLRWLAFSGAASTGTSGSQLLPVDSTGSTARVSLPVSRSIRAEAAVRLGHLWVQGGAVLRDSAVLRAPLIFDRGTPPTVREGRAAGLTYTVVGPLFRGFSLHMNGVYWETGGWYRPRIQARNELTYRYHWTGATKTGGFDLLLAGTADYYTRSRVPSFNADGTVTEIPTFQGAPLGIRLELTIQDATIAFQMRNLLNQPYTTVPGMLMPGPLAVYGVRWTFWN